ncbi:MAG: PBP1A family penicillin-binding protein [Ignavibacteriales bacterium]|nr:PBP1A family penicillin-binding protein [Ignavibacteriales bacterium]
MNRYFNDPLYRQSLLQQGRGFFKDRRNVVIILTVALAILGIAFTFHVVSGMPSLEKLENPQPELATKIIAEDGEILDQLFYKNRTRVSLNQLPRGLVEALIATEDKQYYNHWGIHLERVLKAAVKNILSFSLREGASTITQQLSRNLYLKPDRHVFDKITRKFRELLSSIQIERNFTKDEILELYLNVSYFGRQAYGIEAAAQTYFGKPASKLEPAEYTLLIGILKGPSYYDPLNHLDRAMNRRDIVIGQMVKDGLVTAESAELIRAEVPVIKEPEAEYRTGIAPHFVEMIRRELVRKQQQYGFDALRDGLRVYTTIDSRMQKHAIQAIEDHLNYFQTAFDSAWNWKRYPEILKDNIDKTIKESEQYKKLKTHESRDSLLQVMRADSALIDTVKQLAKTIEVGFVAINPHNGHVLAMVGGKNFRSFKYGLNHVTQIRRQPGSAFKPFVYTVALDNGYPACYELLNQPVTIPMPDGTRWTPSNYDLSIGGKYTLREALKKSINLVTVRAILEIAPAKQVAQYAKRMGIRSRIPAYESIALGSVEVSPLELTSSYCVFPNEGVHVEPISILRIEDKDGNVIEENRPEKREVLSKETAYLMTNLMEGAVNEGTGTAIRRYFYLPAAGKTGTTNDYGDAWFVGFTPQVVAGVWVGFDDGRIKFGTSDGQGGRAAAPIIGKFFQQTYENPDLDLPVEYFNRPDGIVQDTICVDTKKKAREWCPQKMTELFNAKYPIGLCDKHTSALWNEGRETPSKINW